MDRLTHEMRLIKWTPIVQECHNSNMSIKNWCLENNIDERQFYYWQRRVRKEVYDTLKEDESQSQPNFVELTVPEDFSRYSTPFTADMVIHIGNSVLELSNNVSSELLTKVLKVIHNVK